MRALLIGSDPAVAIRRLDELMTGGVRVHGCAHVSCLTYPRGLTQGHLMLELRDPRTQAI